MNPTETFFLWGPRQTGKSTLLRARYPDAFWVDLLQTDRWAQLAARPARLREELTALPKGKLVVIDEVQKVPALLDEVHWLLENPSQCFRAGGLECSESSTQSRKPPGRLTPFVTSFSACPPRSSAPRLI